MRRRPGLVRWPEVAALAFAGALALAPGPASAQLRVSGDVDVLARAGADDRGLNRNFHGDSPWSPLRLRLFAQHWVTEGIGVFAELLWDVDADPRVNGAYVVVNELGGVPWINARVGLAPSPLGSFGLRSTYFNANPLIGVPLLWQHRTSLDPSGLASNEDLVRRRDADLIGVPLLYDACWTLQWGLLGYAGAFEYALAVTPGSVSNPGGARGEDGVQVMGRVGMEPVPGLRFGLSGVRGPWAGGPTFDAALAGRSFPGDPADYPQSAVGVDLEVSRGKFRVLSEAFAGVWEAPLVTDDLTAAAGYVEGRWDFLPAWHGAVRVGAMGFGDISATDDGAGPPTPWEDDVLRVESAVGYRLAREVMVRVGWQHTRFLSGPDDDVDLAAIQLRAVF